MIYLTCAHGQREKKVFISSRSARTHMSENTGDGAVNLTSALAFPYLRSIFQGSSLGCWGAFWAFVNAEEENQRDVGV